MEAREEGWREGTASGKLAKKVAQSGTAARVGGLERAGGGNKMRATETIGAGAVANNDASTSADAIANKAGSVTEGRDEDACHEGGAQPRGGVDEPAGGGGGG